MRVLLNIVAFAMCFSRKWLFAILYFISFMCDGVDGWFARKLNQVSTFGAVLDMVTDRVSTACLLAILSQLYRPGLIFLLLLGLDVASHWLQMYSTFLSGKSSHKDVNDKNSWLLRAYYQHRYFMAFCCVGSEVLYIFLFLIHDNLDESLVTVCMNAVEGSLPLSVIFTVSLFGWGIKQIVNVIQVSLSFGAIA
ncbi:CDP-diacylglycerol--inositol 3-phosphatidyltransferase 1 [Apostasia shenzhenica]|uniref:CDP-diacylglycerol--inositol 3-phosphatidyltransferase n=1 Tax=Apostasia shenzhenica TaxID=1088818 RepID=A0A2I0AK83_9ASPA|nr:CDP-diacylglycerol--inositol 3-phosphatidyltransferase 1 [Apostasia shenzhenica]